MNIFAIDDERLALKALVHAIEEVVPDANVQSFQKPSALLNALPDSVCDVAFLDIKMPGMTGLELARRIKEVHPKVNIIFVTGYNEHAFEAMAMRSSGYVMKPVTREKVEQELMALRHPIEKPAEKKLTLQCFGNFDVFSGGKPLTFHLSKTKELLAYLTDRKGGSCTMGELMSVLWEDREDSDSLRTQLRKLISDLRGVLKEAGMEDVIFKGRNSISLNIEAVSCDYYDYLKDPAAHINRYHGEYMAQYSWAEYTNAALLHE